MALRLLFFVLIFSGSLLFSSEKPKVGLLVMATGRYVGFAEKMIESARKHFLKESEVTYFVFTDQPIKESADLVRIEQKRLGWPYDTMMRFAVYVTHQDKLDKMDYLFACDADMLFIEDVGQEILGERVGTQHPGFVGCVGSYPLEREAKSAAFVAKEEEKIYFAGGFFGASVKEFFKICKTAEKQVFKDLQHQHIAVWHDESHLNRYFTDHPPTLILSPSYCYPEGWLKDQGKGARVARLIACDKDHASIRA